MARDLTAAAAAHAAGTVVRPVIFFEGEFASGTLRLCSLHRSISWNGQTWVGAGRLLGIGAIGETAELRAVGFEVSLTGEVESILSINLAQARQGLPGKVWLGFFGDETIESGTAQAGGADTLTLAAGASATKNAHFNRLLRLTSGAGSVQERRIQNYDGSSKVATVEERWATNMFIHSEAMDNAAWAKQRVTATADVITFRNGMVAEKIIETTASGEHYIERTVGSGAGTWVCSFHVKAAGRTRFEIVAIHVGETVSTTHIGVDLTAGTIVAPLGRVTDSSIEDQGNGEFRIGIVFTTTAACSSLRGRIRLNDASGNGVYTGDGSSGIYLTGGQFEAASILGDYIKTEAAAITLPDNTTVYELVDENGLIADPFQCFQGRLDFPDIVDDGATARIAVHYESRLIDLDRVRERKYTHEDQQIDYPGDKGFNMVPKLQDAEIYFGSLTLEQLQARKARHRARAAAANRAVQRTIDASSAGAPGGF